MILTGKTKTQFNEWIFKYFKDNLIIYTYKNIGYYADEVDVDIDDIFEHLPFSAQYGILVDFFDSVGMQIYVKPLVNKTWSVYIDNYGTHVMEEYLLAPTRRQAREEAIKKANEILNEKL